MVGGANILRYTRPPSTPSTTTHSGLGSFDIFTLLWRDLHWCFERVQTLFFFISEPGMATLTGVGVSADPGARAGAMSTTTWNTRDTGGGATSSLGLGGGPMTGATANGVRLAAIFGDVGVGGGLAGLWIPKASSAAVAG